MKKFFGLTLGVLLVAAMLLSSFSMTPSLAQDKKVLRTAYLPGDVILDPSLGTWVNEIQIINELFPGITTLNELTVEVEPGIASDWTVSEDGMTYTFNIMQGVPWVRYDADSGQVVEVTDADGNVRTVNAKDIAYGINRTLTPDTGSQYAGTLAPWIVNGTEKLAGQDVELGVVAVDDATLQITSPKPAGFLLMMYGLWMSRPEPQWLIDEYG